jgi:hypothetical protein
MNLTLGLLIVDSGLQVNSNLCGFSIAGDEDVLEVSIEVILQ